MTKDKIRNHPILHTTISLLLFVFLWQMYVSIFNVPHFMLPSPLSVLQETMYQFSHGEIWLHIGITLYEISLGFILSIGVGVLLGYLLYKSEFMSDVLKPFLVFLQVAPKIALVPLFIVWFGLGMTSKIIVVFSMALFPIIIGVESALRNIPDEYYDLLSVLKADKKQAAFDIEMPFVLPEFFSSLKIAIVQAIIGATVAEWMSGQIGLGYIQTFASSTFDTSLLITGILITIILGVILYQIIEMIETRIVYWK